MRSFLYILVLPVSVFLASGCASLRPLTDPVQDRKAAELALGTRAMNRDILSSKGTGWVTLDMDGRKDRFRLAWAAQTPNRARITLLASGIPFETIAADGKSVTFFSHTHAHPTHTVSRPDPDLSRIVHIRIRLSEIVSVLLGQIPLGPFDDAWFSPDNPDEIVLKQTGSSVIHTLVPGPGGMPRSLTRRDGSGQTVYDFAVLCVKSLPGRDIPEKLLIRDTLSRTIDLTITRFIPNPPIKESVFVLTEPGS